MPTPHGYSQVIEYAGNGKLVFISGQVSAHANGGIIGTNSLEEQAHQTFTNIKNAVEAVGGEMQHLVKLNSFLKDINQIEILRKIRDMYINTQNPPASTAIQTAFDDETILVEIDAIAIIPL